MKNIIVLFEVEPTKAGMQKYLDLAAMLKPLLSGFEGFIRAERFSSLNEEGKLLSMNVWTDEAAVERWRNVMQHRMSQKEGREKLFEARFWPNTSHIRILGIGKIFPIVGRIPRILLTHLQRTGLLGCGCWDRKSVGRERVC